jgi:hypothetical protein
MACLRKPVSLLRFRADAVMLDPNSIARLIKQLVGPQVYLMSARTSLWNRALSFSTKHSGQMAHKSLQATPCSAPDPRTLRGCVDNNQSRIFQR